MSRIHLSIALVLVSTSALLAQQPAAETIQQRVSVPTSSTPPMLPPSASGGSDLGQISAVQSYPKPETLTLSTSQQYFYTNNVFYTHDGTTTSSQAYLGSYTLSYVPYSTRDWTPRISAQYNMVRYGNVASGDFDNENLTASSQYVFSDDRSWSWTAGVNLGRFTYAHVPGGMFYHEVVYDNQVNKVIQLSKDTPFYFMGGYDLAYHQAGPAIYNRLDNTFSLSLIYYVLPELSVSGYIHPGVRTYVTNGTYTTTTGVVPGALTGLVQNDRNDFNLSEGFDVTYQPNKYLSVSADVSHTDDYSSNNAFTYHDTIPGVSLSGTLKFW